MYRPVFLFVTAEARTFSPPGDSGLPVYGQLREHVLHLTFVGSDSDSVYATSLAIPELQELTRQVRR